MTDLFSLDANTILNSNENVSLNKEEVVNVLRLVLQTRFPNDNQRREIDSKGSNRINFCCPYCGDSHKDPNKKRGNVYLTTATYKCYNGGCIAADRRLTFHQFLKDFSVEDKVSVDLISTAQFAASSSVSYNSVANKIISFNSYIDNSYKDLLVSRQELINTLKLKDVNVNSPAGVYLKKRQQYIDNKFAVDKYGNIFIFNLDDTTEKIFSLQIRYMGNKVINRYKTYKLSAIYEKLLKIQQLIPQNIDDISLLFGLHNLDFSRTITIFEGPLDSFLLPNSIALCSVSNRWPFGGIERYLFDNDIAGIKKMIELSNKEKSIFMWEKFLLEHKLPKGKIKDLTDVIVYCKAHSININIEPYFTKDCLDIINI
jgi:hypothetical protein